MISTNMVEMVGEVLCVCVCRYIMTVSVYVVAAFIVGLMYAGCKHPGDSFPGDYYPIFHSGLFITPVDPVVTRHDRGEYLQAATGLLQTYFESYDNSSACIVATKVIRRSPLADAVGQGYHVMVLKKVAGSTGPAVKLFHAIVELAYRARLEDAILLVRSDPGTTIAPLWGMTNVEVDFSDFTEQSGVRNIGDAIIKLLKPGQVIIGIRVFGATASEAGGVITDPVAQSIQTSLVMSH